MARAISCANRQIQECNEHAILGAAQAGAMFFYGHQAGISPRGKSELLDECKGIDMCPASVPRRPRSRCRGSRRLSSGAKRGREGHGRAAGAAKVRWLFPSGVQSEIGNNAVARNSCLPGRSRSHLQTLSISESQFKIANSGNALVLDDKRASFFVDFAGNIVPHQCISPKQLYTFDSHDYPPEKVAFILLDYRAGSLAIVVGSG